jgi:hypothetical protein
MKLFLRKDCEHCSDIDTSGIDVKVIYVDDNYDGLVPQQVPIIQFGAFNFQLNGEPIINAMFNEIRKQK